MAASMQSQAFWDEFMKRPDAQQAYEAKLRLQEKNTCEDYGTLQEKKRAWLEERRAIEERGERRRIVANALEEASAETKKLIAPMFHIRLVEEYLWHVHEEAEKHRVPFLRRLQDEDVQGELRNYRVNFQEGGEERMADMEKQAAWISREIALDEERKRELEPRPIDINTLKDVLEFGQACKFEGNEKFREGLFEEALRIYAQGDEEMKKWRVENRLRNEQKWLQDEHLACLKNKSQAALRLELFQTALDAAEAALKIDNEDHKAWYRKLQAQKGLGKFKDAEESLERLEDVAQWCPDRRRILRDCDAERKKLKIARAKHRHGTRAMLGKAFEAGVFSLDRERELEEATKSLEAAPKGVNPPKQLLKQKWAGSQEVPDKASARALTSAAPKADDEAAKKQEERKIHLTLALAGDLMDELAEAYAQKWFQERVRKCARDSGYERAVFLMRLRDIAFQVQKPVLEKWGFEGNEQGVREMTAAIRDHAADGKEMPDWLKQKQDRCLELLYGGKEGKMLDILTK